MSTEVPKLPDAEVARRAAEQWGVLSLAELRACGLAESAVTLRVRKGHLHRVHRGVYAVGHANLPPEGRWLAAVKACGPGAVLSHVSAGALWGIVAWDGRSPEVTVPGPSKRRHAGVRVRRSPLGPDDVTRRQGIPVTVPARTLVDLAAVLAPRALRRATGQAMSLRLVHPARLAAALQRTRTRRGRGALARILAAGPAPTRSELEDVVLELLRRGGLERPQVNVPIFLGGRRILPDFRWPAQRLILEADGAAWHAHRVAREDDAARQALLERHGERVLRVTWQQAVARPEETLARLRAAGAPVCSAGAPDASPHGPPGRRTGMLPTLEIPAPSDPVGPVVPDTPSVPADPVPGPEAPDVPTGPDAPEPNDPLPPEPDGPDVPQPDPGGPETAALARP
jgi:very-short-patch-repair endonuclease